MDLNFSCELEMIPMGLDAAVAAADLLPVSTGTLALVACALLLAWSHTRQSSVPGDHLTHTHTLTLQSYFTLRCKAKHSGVMKYVK